MKRTGGAALLAAALAALCAAPYLYVFCMSFVGPDGLTLRAYYDVFLGDTQYLVRFWRSLALSGVIALVQVAVSTLAGFGFAKARFPGRDALFFLLMVMMVLPLQVTLVPNYLMLRAMGLLDTVYALALPAGFVPLGTFIMTRGFQSVPNEIIEAAKLDGCGLMQIIWRVAAPMNVSGLVCTGLLSFLDSWNMVEQPMTYLEDEARYPLSVWLATTAGDTSALRMVCCILVALPPLFLFSIYKRKLVEGIVMGGEK